MLGRSLCCTWWVVSLSLHIKYADRLQVAAKYMPMASIKIGVDLVPIKAIKGCMTFTADITTTRCVNLIKKELKHFKADVVLHDGAPNVGAEWTKDAYN